MAQTDRHEGVWESVDCWRVNRWTEARVMAGFALRQRGTERSHRCFSSQINVFTVSCCSHTVKMWRGKKGVADSSWSLVLSSLQISLALAWGVWPPDCQHPSAQSHRTGERPSTPWPLPGHSSLILGICFREGN